MYLEDGENPLALAFILVAAYDAAQGPGASPTHLLLRYWYVTPGSHISVMSGERWVSFTTAGQALRKERCSHLSPGGQVCPARFLREIGDTLESYTWADILTHGVLAR